MSLCTQPVVRAFTHTEDENGWAISGSCTAPAERCSGTEGIRVARAHPISEQVPWLPHRPALGIPASRIAAQPIGLDVFGMGRARPVHEVHRLVAVVNEDQRDPSEHSSSRNGEPPKRTGRTAGSSSPPRPADPSTPPTSPAASADSATGPGSAVSASTTSGTRPRPCSWSRASTSSSLRNSSATPTSASPPTSTPTSDSASNAKPSTPWAVPRHPGQRP